MTQNFQTPLLAFAAYLHATARLRFLRTTPGDGRVALFVFADPRNEGAQLLKEFEARKTFVEPRSYHQSMRTLRAELDSVSPENNEEYECHKSS
jgi:hypothetical protein